MDLERVIAALAPRDVVGRASLDVADLAYDTRAITPGALFFCVRGANVDGHELAPQALQAGAAALVVERPVAPAPVPQLVVADSRAAMAVAADVFFGHPTHELDVVGVTGTNGKTTTAHLVYAILAAAGRRPGGPTRSPSASTPPTRKSVPMPSTGSTSSCAAASTSRTPSARSPPRACSGSTTRRRRAASRPSAASRAASNRSTRASRST